MTEPKIVLLSKEDMLNDYHNVHLKEATSAEINIKVYQSIIAEKGEKFVVREEPQQAINQEGKPIVVGVVKVKAIDALKVETERLGSQKRILKSIEELQKEHAKQ